MGSDWYDLGTVTLSPSDSTSSIGVSTGLGSEITQFALLEQTGTTFYDAMGNALSQVDGLNRVSTAAFNSVEQQTSTSAGQIVSLNTDTNKAAFPNLPQTPGLARTFTIYVQSSSAPTSGDTTITDSESHSTTFSFYTGDASVTPLGYGWYELGTVELTSTDTSSSLSVEYTGGGVSNVCLVQPMSETAYTPTGLVSAEFDGDGDVDVTGYDALGEPVTASQGQTSAFRFRLGGLPQPGADPQRAKDLRGLRAIECVPSGTTTVGDDLGGDSGSPMFSAYSGDASLRRPPGPRLVTTTWARSRPRRRRCEHVGDGRLHRILGHGCAMALVQQTSTAVYNAVGQVTATNSPLPAGEGQGEGSEGAGKRYHGLCLWLWLDFRRQYQQLFSRRLGFHVDRRNPLAGFWFLRFLAILDLQQPGSAERHPQRFPASRVYSVYAQASSDDGYFAVTGEVYHLRHARPRRLRPGQRLGLGGQRDPQRPRHNDPRRHARHNRHGRERLPAAIWCPPEATIPTEIS